MADVGEGAAGPFAASLAAEVGKYNDALHRRAANGAGDVVEQTCKLCPFRSFKRRAQLVEHMKYHTAPFFTAAAHGLRTKTYPQLNVAKALHRHRMAQSICGPSGAADDLLEKSASMIRGWNRGAPPAELEVLKRNNQVPVVMVLTRSGPEYWLKCRTADATRANEKVYYSRDFEDAVIGLALRCRGHVGAIVDEMLARWAEDAEGVPLLFPTMQVTVKECVIVIFKSPDGVVQSALRRLKAAATERGEWVAIAHDATFKITFSIIGQSRMAQRDGERHTAHTFIGVTGACPGFSLQPKEGIEPFTAALRDRFTDEMISQVRFLFTDSPSEGFLGALPNGLACAEDAMHLVFRVEHCFGQKRNSCSRAIMAIQKKFLVAAPGAPTADDLYHGSNSGVDIWDEVGAVGPRSGREEADFMGQPFQAHAEYVAELKRVAATYPDDMARKNLKGDYGAPRDPVRGAARPLRVPHEQLADQGHGGGPSRHEWHSCQRGRTSAPEALDPVRVPAAPRTAGDRAGGARAVPHAHQRLQEPRGCLAPEADRQADHLHSVWARRRRRAQAGRRRGGRGCPRRGGGFRRRGGRGRPEGGSGAAVRASGARASGGG